MRALGIAVKIDGKKATVVGVVVDDELGPDDDHDIARAKVTDSFNPSFEPVTEAQQLREAHKAVRSRVEALRPDAVIIRRADWSAQASRQEGPRLRLLVEGAIAAAAHDVEPNTHVRTGKDCGTAHGTDKATLDSAAQGIQGGRYREATAAALSGLVANRPSPQP